MLRHRSQKLPRSGSAREALRAKGQFWTPDWVADVMADYVLQGKPDRLLDPAFGGGAFFRAAKRCAARRCLDVALFGCDIDPSVIAEAERCGLAADDLKHVEIRDFVLDPPDGTFPAILANPPYIRHHRLPPTQKERLRRFASEITGRRIDGRAGLHVYFLIRALRALAPQGRLAYIVSADICEGVFADALWRWVAAHYRLDAVITFAPEAAPFPDVDTNALIFCIRNAKPARDLLWVRCLAPDSDALSSAILDRAIPRAEKAQARRRALAEALSTGLSRPPEDRAPSHYTLGDFATVMRGIVTGHNAFFFLTTARVRELGIPQRLLVKALGRTRDVRGDSFGEEDLIRLDAAGRPLWLLNVNGLQRDALPPTVQNYLKQGESEGLPEKPLIRTRKPWYRMETRKPPPILFAYLGRRNARFIRNRAGVVPLTCLLCVYPKLPDPDYLERLWRVVSHPDTIVNLRKVGKSYGGGAIKVEPRALERLPLPDALVRREGLDRFSAPPQGDLFRDL